MAGDDIVVITRDMLDRYLSLKGQVNYTCAYVYNNRILLCKEAGYLDYAEAVDMAMFKRHFNLSGISYEVDYKLDVPHIIFAGIKFYDINAKHLAITAIHTYIRKHNEAKSLVQHYEDLINSSLALYNAKYDDGYIAVFSDMTRLIKGEKPQKVQDNGC